MLRIPSAQSGPGSLATIGPGQATRAGLVLAAEKWFAQRGIPAVTSFRWTDDHARVDWSPPWPSDR